MALPYAKDLRWITNNAPRQRPTRIGSAPRRSVIDEAARRSLPDFYAAAYKMVYPNKPVPTNKYIFAMLHQIEELVTGDLRRLVNNIPPRHGKTEFGTIMLAAWILGRDPSAKIFVVSYGLELSEGITRKIRQLMEHPDYKRIFPGTRLKVGHNRGDHFVTTQGGECMACSQDSGITGFGAHYMLIDDFQKADDALSPLERENAILTFKNTLMSRFDDLAQSRILINQQRLHFDDLSGHAIRLGWRQLKMAAVAEEDEEYPMPGGGVWRRKKGHVLDPIRMPQHVLDEQKLAMGFRAYSAQFQQNPDVSDSCLIDWNWCGEYDEEPPRNKLLLAVQSIDPALTERLDADYSVGMTWGWDGEDWYMLELFREQIGFNLLLDRLVSWHGRWKADVMIIEGGSIGTALFDQTTPSV